jgi:hypothetical protein
MVHDTDEFKAVCDDMEKLATYEDRRKVAVMRREFQKSRFDDDCRTLKDYCQKVAERSATVLGVEPLIDPTPVQTYDFLQSYGLMPK